MRKLSFRLTYLFILLFISFASYHAQIITTFAGNGIQGFGGDGGLCTSATLSGPRNAAFDATGNIYIGDYLNRRIRKVNSSGIISTIAGTGVIGYSGDGGLAINAQLYSPSDIAVDASGNIYFTDTWNYVIRKIDPSGIITTIAGDGVKGNTGNGGPAIDARLWNPEGMIIDKNNNIFFTEGNGHRVRKIDASGIITLIAGTSQGYSGDGGQASAAKLNYPMGITVDVFGNLYIAEEGNHIIRKIDTLGVISTLAGNGGQGSSGDGANALNATLNSPIDVSIDSSFNLYVADYGNDKIRRIDGGGIISTYAGTGVQGYSGDGGPAFNAQLTNVHGVDVDGMGNLYIADWSNERVRKIDCAYPLVSVPGISGNNFICPESATYIYSVSPIVGASSYSWILPNGWTGSSTTNSISATTNGTSGLISLSVKNACGLPSAQSTLMVGLNPSPSVSATLSNSVICLGDSVVLTAHGANTYTWSTGVVSDHAEVSPLVDTSYSVTGTDLNGCINNYVQAVQVLLLPDVQISAPAFSLCSGTSSFLSASGAISYTWLPGNAVGSSVNISPVADQTYTLIGIDNNSGCSNIDQVNISVISSPVVSVTPFFYICSGSATLNAVGATTYTWMPGGLTGNSLTPSPTITTNYTVVGSDGICSNIAVSTVSLGVAPPLIISSDAQFACANSCLTFTNTINSFNSIIFDWSDNTVSVADSFMHCFSVAGSYTVSAMATYSSGCLVQNANQLVVTIFPNPIAGIRPDYDNSYEVNVPLAFTNTSTGGQFYKWMFDDGSPSIESFIADKISHNYLKDGINCVKLIAVDTITRCKDSSSVCVEIINSIIPNVFTPNGDGVNDVWQFNLGKESTLLNISIYNRWGNLINDVNMNNNTHIRWDGRTTSGVALSEGTYFYILEYKNVSEETFKKRGFLNLFR
ncbi:MAG: hypothetical protein K0S53_1538 [Bacteroidetes bacterium]|jgi:gliding motility-associated-like protein|nr:hypothetical protein [Bacteroidota bacterium]MDF2450862.1 hypothetical protein [Bacteroidota bacterium]